MSTAELNLSNLPTDIIRMIVQATTIIWESDEMESENLFGNMESVGVVRFIGISFTNIFLHIIVLIHKSIFIFRNHGMSWFVNIAIVSR